jgi:hypothetical protein
MLDSVAIAALYLFNPDPDPEFGRIRIRIFDKEMLHFWGNSLHKNCNIILDLHEALSPLRQNMYPALRNVKFA